MYYYIYKITNLINGKIYIGQHTTDNLDDGYMGSGVMLHKAFKKYGIENFKKEILRFVDTKEDLDDLERWLVYPEFVKRSDNYNVSLGGGGCGVGEANPFYGKHHSEETKDKIRTSKAKSYKKEKHPNFGKHHSEETRRKISESKKGHTSWNKGKSKQKFQWITEDGSIREMDRLSVNRWHPNWVLVK